MNTLDILPYYEKECTCPVCSGAFTTRKIRSRFARVVKTDSDFAPVYEDKYNPIYYRVNVCPHCGYSYNDHFNDRLTARDKEIIQVKISDGWNNVDYGHERTSDHAIATHKLALLSGTLTSEKSLVIGGICLRLGWLYREINNQNQERRFLNHALSEYKKAQNSFEIFESTMSEIRLKYLIGELHRRLHDDEAAIHYFTGVLKHRDLSSERDVMTLAELQMRELTKESKIAL
ncbi:DUF2225 domain-containing protein [Bacillus sp. FJAT-45350]|uniref:DUF2225 domain-containing protein n=1 Tax=Bacillus sp. FJAT-45350 TaxID=2011014 RepID=UPI0015C8E1C3|nr:DUF2225 domain-containing protein [Bacillus sp. FJAT-45350]